MTKRSGPRASTSRADRPSFDPADFPGLVGFVRGYLHEDFVYLYGSPVAAVSAFCADAGLEERQRLDREIATLTDPAGGHSHRAVRRFLCETLGSRWAPRSPDDLQALRTVIAAAR